MHLFSYFYLEILLSVKKQFTVVISLFTLASLVFGKIRKVKPVHCFYSFMHKVSL